MTGQTSRKNRDVRCETSLPNRDVSPVCHGSTVTFQREPSLSFCTTATTYPTAPSKETPMPRKTYHPRGGRRRPPSPQHDWEWLVNELARRHAIRSTTGATR